MNKHTEIDYMLFDLDNTLYPASSRVEDEFNRRIVEYVARFLDISIAEADVRKTAGFREYGTTVSWLIAEHGLTDIEDYFAWIHMKDIGKYIGRNPELSAMLKRITIPRSILTNAIREHAERVLEALGVRHEFERIFDIRDYNLNNKPSPKAYQTALAAIDIPVKNILFIDDNIHFLQPFAELGGEVLLIDEDQKHPESPYPSIRKITELENFLNCL